MPGPEHWRNSVCADKHGGGPNPECCGGEGDQRATSRNSGIHATWPVWATWSALTALNPAVLAITMFVSTKVGSTEQTDNTSSWSPGPGPEVSAWCLGSGFAPEQPALAGGCPGPQVSNACALPEPPHPAHRRGGGTPAQGGAGSPGAGSDTSLRQKEGRSWH
ncbi:uncharacterized protein LOC115838264 [Nomascus leucogenys]|uniref:uncharacterized protein LOC115838264 n=1 Tax=Nomascus leucogenys TaxID=61853 RepID=UPI00122D8946|nr:uncharacterized protein LOC115838264 [Nomascus leucogenys]